MNKVLTVLIAMLAVCMLIMLIIATQGCSEPIPKECNENKAKVAKMTKYLYPECR